MLLEGVGWLGRGLMATGLLAGAGYLGVAAEHEDADEETVAQADVPAAVMQAAQAEVVQGKFLSAEREDEDGQLRYELAFSVPEGSKVEVKLLADGTVVEREQKITEEALPAAVREALAGMKTPGNVVSIEKKTITLYEIKRKSEGKVSEMMLDAGGRRLHDESGEEHEGEGDED